MSNKTPIQSLVESLVALHGKEIHEVVTNTRAFDEFLPRYEVKQGSVVLPFGTGFAVFGADGLVFLNSNNGIVATMSTSGQFRAVTKSFCIDNPSHPEEKLIYGSVEAPGFDIYIRGDLSHFNLTPNYYAELPDYWAELVGDTYDIEVFGRTFEVLDRTDRNFLLRIDGDVNQKVPLRYRVTGTRKDIAGE